MAHDRRYLLVALAAYTVFLAALSGTYSSYGSDEAFYMNVAKDMLDGEGYTGDTIAPVMSLLIAGIALVVQDVELAARILNPIAVVVTSAVVYFFSGHILGKRSIWPSVIFMTLPMVPILGIRILPDALFNMFLVTTIYFFYLAVKKNPYWFVPTGALLSLTFFTRYAAVLIVPIILAYFIIDRKSLSSFKKKETYFGILTAIAVFAVISVPIFGTDISYITSNVSAYTDTTIDEPFYFYALFFPLVPFAFSPLLAVGVYKMFKVRKEVAWLTVSMAILVLYKLAFLPIREFRYMIDSSAFVVIIAFAGSVYLMTRLKNDKSVYLKIAMAVMVAINLAAALYIAIDFSDSPRYDEIREASIWADSNCEGQITSNAGRHTELYTGKDPVSLTSNNFDSIPSGTCIIYSPYEPAVDFNAELLDSSTLLNRFGQVTVHAK